LEEGGSSGTEDEATALEKRRKSKAVAKLKRERRQALISKLGLMNVRDGFRVVENEVLLLVGEYVRFCVERFGSSVGVGSMVSGSVVGSVKGGGLVVNTRQVGPESGRWSSVEGGRFGESGAVGLAGKFTMPFGPAFPPGSLQKRVAQTQHHVRMALQREGKRGGGGGGGGGDLGVSFRLEDDGDVESGVARRGGGGGAGVNRRGSVDEVFLTREEIMVSMALDGKGELG
jgi:hypothetical protein